MQIQIWKAWTWRQWVGSGSLGLLEGYGGWFEAAEHGGKAVDIDSTSYMCAMLWDYTSAAWVHVAVLGSASVCLSAYECVCAKPKCVEIIGTRNAKIRA